MVFLGVYSMLSVSLESEVHDVNDYATEGEQLEFQQGKRHLNFLFFASYWSQFLIS